MGKDGQQDSSFFKNSFLQVIFFRLVVLKLLNASELAEKCVKTQLPGSPSQSFCFCTSRERSESLHFFYLFENIYLFIWGFPVVLVVKNLPAKRETHIRSMG